MTNKTATERLREMLDELGVHWVDSSTAGRYGNHIAKTQWIVFDRSARLTEWGNGTVRFECGGDFTPEQAIAATLVDDAYDAVANEHVITAEQLHALLDEWDKHPGRAATDGEMMTYATLGVGECKVVASSTDGLTTDEPKQWFKLSCGHAFKLYGLGRPVACPVCGKAVKR